MDNSFDKFYITAYIHDIQEFGAKTVWAVLEETYCKPKTRMKYRNYYHRAIEILNEEKYENL